MHSIISDRFSHLPIGKAHKKVTVLIGFGLFFEFFELFLASILASVLVTKFSINAELLPLLLGSSFLGMFVGALFLSRFADQYGRKKTFILNLFLYSFFTLLVIFSPNATVLILFRFLAGVGLGAQPALCDTYLTEILPAAKRGKFIAWAYTLGFIAVPIEGFLGRSLVTLSPLGIEGWKWMFIIGSLGIILALIAKQYLPESPRWLVSKGRVKEAEEIIQSFTGDNSKVNVHEFIPIQQNKNNDIPKKVPYSSIFKKNVLPVTIMLFIFQIFQTIGYYGFGTLGPMVLDSKGYSITHSLEFISLSFLGYPLGSLLSVPIIERVDRKWLVVLSAFAMGCFGLLFGMANSVPLIILSGFLYTLVSNIFSNAFHILQAEIFPTAIRATATGVTYSLSRLMSGLMPFILLPVLKQYGATTMFTVVALSMLVIILDIAILAPRTNGRSLDSLDDTEVLSNDENIKIANPNG